MLKFLRARGVCAIVRDPVSLRGEKGAASRALNLCIAKVYVAATPLGATLNMKFAAIKRPVTCSASNCRAVLRLSFRPPEVAATRRVPPSTQIKRPETGSRGVSGFACGSGRSARTSSEVQGAVDGRDEERKEHDDEGDPEGHPPEFLHLVKRHVFSPQMRPRQARPCSRFPRARARNVFDAATPRAEGSLFFPYRAREQHSYDAS